MLKGKLWILGVIISLLIISACVIAECDEERIRIAMTDLISTKAREVNTNVDNSFKAYEQFNSEQLAQFTTKVHSNLQQGVIFGLVALFAIILLTMSLWSLISLKVQKRLTTLMVDDIKSLKKILEQKSVSIYEPVPQSTNIQLPPEHENKPRKRGLFKSREEKQAEKEMKLAQMKAELEQAQAQREAELAQHAELAKRQAFQSEMARFEEMQHALIDQQKRLEQLGAQFDVPAEKVAEEEKQGDVAQDALLPPMPKRKRKPVEEPKQDGERNTVSTGYEFDADADSETRN
jgi:hypothetical protein